MARARRRALGSLLAAGMLLTLAAGTTDAASPKVHYAFSACLTMVEGFDQDGNPIGLVPALEQLYSWSGARVDAVSGSWTRSDGQDAGFGYLDNDFAPARSGSVDAGALTIQSDPGLDGLFGGFYAHGKLLFGGTIAEPIGGWTSVAACA